MDNPSAPLLRTNRSWLIPAVALGLVLIGSGVAYTIVKDRTSTIGDLTITKVGDGAFGNLAFNGAADYSRSSEATLTADAPTSSGGGASDASTLIYPGTSYLFSYSGPAVPQNQSQLPVFRRIMPTGPTLGGLLANRSPFTKPSFSGATVQSVSFTQGADKYRADLDFVAGYLNISLDMSSGEFPTGSPKQLDNSRLIEIANNFVDTFGVSRAGLGEPEVISSTFGLDLPATTESSDAVQTSVTAAPDTKLAYTPDQAVLYPFSINGYPVYDLGGNKVGMTVTINTGLEKVLYLSMQMGSEFESSLYDAETDFDTIKASLAEGGVQKLYYYTNSNERETISVETPSLVYVQTSLYTETVPTTLYAPAYIFPVSLADQSKVYVKNVVVPLVNGVGDGGVRILDGGSGGSIEPMPAER